ncbi:MAG: polysaccharide deacetylase family protein [Nitrosomonas sp.]|nr:polysaccharide deacetylase family protein [Nitrosomonas sp.]
MARQHRIVVFSGLLSYSVRKGIVEIDRSLDSIEWLIVVHAPRKSVFRLLYNQWLNLKKHGWRWIPYQLADIVDRLFPSGTTITGQKLPGDEFSLASMAHQNNITIHYVNDIHAPSTLAQVKAFGADLGLSLAAPILKRELFGLPSLGTINLHKGKVPDYRGMPPAFWEMWNDERGVGCTVHRVDAQLDAGDVYGEVTVSRQTYSTVGGLQLTLDEVGVELMRSVVQSIFNGSATATAQAQGGAIYRKPTLEQIVLLRRKLERRVISPKARIIEFCKGARGQLALQLWRFGLWRILKPRVTVLLYHRVSDDVRDNLTVGIEQFGRQMALIKRHCDIWSIEQLVECKLIPKSSRPQVAITFDDGYLDNFVNAAAILQRYQIPAGFFIATGIVNTDKAFPHDVRRGNEPIPMMTWDNLRTMRDAGFTLGSHTINHIDCAKENESLVTHELTRSLADIEYQLGIAVPIFAYPYGGKQHMTDERLELVKQTGYSACLSAYGGSNIENIDKFNVFPAWDSLGIQ